MLRTNSSNDKEEVIAKQRSTLDFSTKALVFGENSKLESVKIYIFRYVPSTFVIVMFSHIRALFLLSFMSKQALAKW